MRILGIDIGTTTVSAVVVEAEKQKVESVCTIENGSFMRAGFAWEKIQNPDSILNKVFELTDKFLEEYEDIRGIGLTGQMHGIVYVDQNGKHISPLYTWQDGRGNQVFDHERSICGMLEEDFAVKAYAGYGLVTHIYNCRHHLVPKEAAKICTIADYLGMRLTERKTPLVHSSNAAGMGLYDAGEGRFLETVLTQAGADIKILPQVTDDFSCIGTYRGIPVSTAVGDNQAGFLGSVQNAADSVLVNIGTGGQVSVLSKKYYTSKGTEARPFAKGYYLLAGSSLCGGRAYAVLEHFFRSYAEAAGIRNADHYHIMEKILNERSAQTEKLRVRTSFSGTREKPAKRGFIKNIGTENFTPEALICGVLDGMAEELYQMYRKMEKGLGLSMSRVIASGNGIRRNCHLQEMIREKFGMDLQMAEHEEEAAYGAAVSGMIASGYLTLNEAVGIK